MFNQSKQMFFIQLVKPLQWVADLFKAQETAALLSLADTLFAKGSSQRHQVINQWEPEHIDQQLGNWQPFMLWQLSQFSRGMGCLINRTIQGPDYDKRVCRVLRQFVNGSEITYGEILRCEPLFRSAGVLLPGNPFEHLRALTHCQPGLLSVSFQRGNVDLFGLIGQARSVDELTRSIQMEQWFNAELADPLPVLHAA